MKELKCEKCGHIIAKMMEDEDLKDSIICAEMDIPFDVAIINKYKEELKEKIDKIIHKYYGTGLNIQVIKEILELIE